MIYCILTCMVIGVVIFPFQVHIYVKQLCSLNNKWLDMIPKQILYVKMVLSLFEYKRKEPQR